MLPHAKWIRSADCLILEWCPGGLLTNFDPKEVRWLSNTSAYLFTCLPSRGGVSTQTPLQCGQTWLLSKKLGKMVELMVSDLRDLVTQGATSSSWISHSGISWLHLMEREPCSENRDLLPIARLVRCLESTCLNPSQAFRWLCHTSFLVPRDCEIANMCCWESLSLGILCYPEIVC